MLCFTSVNCQKRRRRRRNSLTQSVRSGVWGGFQKSLSFYRRGMTWLNCWLYFVFLSQLSKFHLSCFACDLINLSLSQLEYILRRKIFHISQFYQFHSTLISHMFRKILKKKCLTKEYNNIIFPYLTDLILNSIKLHIKTLSNMSTRLTIINISLQ